MYLDVFLSFSGEDVRKKFLSHLCREFSRKGIIAFKKEEEDDKKEKGEKISSSLLSTILKSKVAVVVLSKNYAYSTLCLDELDKIMGRAQKELRAVVPVFYEVGLSDVRSQTGIFVKALERHAQVENPQTLQRWKGALIKLTNEAGFFSHKSEDDSKLIRDITRHVSDLLSKSRLDKDLPPGKASGEENTVNKTSLSQQLSNSETPDAILRHMECIYTVLDLESTSEVRVIGISGVEGIGKTTVARRLYQHLSSAFQDHCFLENSRNILDHISGTQGKSPYQKLNPASQDHCFLWTSKNIHDQGHNLAASSDSMDEVNSPRSLKRKAMERRSSGFGSDDQKRTRFCNQRVLAIVDNVEKTEQLEEIMKDVNSLGSGSRVIIVTTQNKSWFLTCGIEHVYELDSLKNDEALELFSKCAFKKQYPPANFEQLSFRAVQLTGCRPLGLKVLGSFLHGKSEEDWKTELQMLEGQDKAIVKRRSIFSTLLLCQDKTEEDWKCRGSKPKIIELLKLSQQGIPQDQD